jgi:hypothetical protein
VWGIKRFLTYPYGLRFKVVSDHKPLTWITSVKDPGSMLLMWRIHHEEYDYEIVYKQGARNANANALSRISTFEKESCASGEMDSNLKAYILHENHDSNLGGHRGMNKTYEAIKRHQWPNMR